MRDRLLINGILVMAYCGCLPEEHERRQPFEVDLDMRVDISKAIKSDNLKDAVDYESVVKEINDYFVDNKIKLIERMAAIVADIVLENKQVLKVKVTLRKLHPPVSYSLNYSGIILTRSNKEN